MREMIGSFLNNCVMPDSVKSLGLSFQASKKAPSLAKFWKVSDDKPGYLFKWPNTELVVSPTDCCFLLSEKRIWDQSYKAVVEKWWCTKIVGCTDILFNLMTQQSNKNFHKTTL